MNKILQSQLKSLKKELFFILFIPLILSLVYFLFSISPLPNLFSESTFKAMSLLFFGLGIALVFLGYGAIFLISLTRDYQAFFGEGASFYSALPIPPGQVLAARYLYYLIVSLVSFFINTLSQLIFFFSLVRNQVWQQVLATGELKEAINLLRHYLGNLSPAYFLIFFLILSITIFFKLGLIIFSISFGSEKRFRKFGVGGPILTYIASSILASLVAFTLISLPIYIGLTSSRAGFHLILTPSSQVSSHGDTLLAMVYFCLPYLVDFLIALYFCYRSYLSHRDKLSVY